MSYLSETRSPSEGVRCARACSGVASALLLSITFIVLGALGAQGTIYMAPIGAEIMLTIGTAIILAMISGVMKRICNQDS